MALFPKSLFLFLALFLAILCSCSSSHAFTLEVGGSKGWTLNPPETYSAWSHRLRLNVNDTLHFKYNAATDSVLVVSKDDYDNCNSNSPIKKLDGDGDSRFTFDRSGPFYFITGNKSNCDQGQKLHVVVLAVRKNLPPPAYSPASPAPGAIISSAPVTSPSDGSAPAAHGPAQSSASATFNAISTVPFVVMIISLAFAWVIVC